MTKHWSWECTRYAIGLKWTTVFIQRSLRASSAIWTILASRLLSRASLESALHGIPQMESLLVGYIQRTLSLPRSLFCLVARVTRQQRLASETSAHSVQWKALNVDRFLIVWNEDCRIYAKWKFYLLVSVKNNGTQLPFFFLSQIAKKCERYKSNKAQGPGTVHKRTPDARYKGYRWCNSPTGSVKTCLDWVNLVYLITFSTIMDGTGPRLLAEVIFPTSETYRKRSLSSQCTWNEENILKSDEVWCMAGKTEVIRFIIIEIRL